MSSSEENSLVLETIHSALVNVHGYTDIKQVLRDITILSGNFRFARREIPHIYAAYNHLLKKLATFPVNVLTFKQWEILIESICTDGTIHETVYPLTKEEQERLDDVKKVEIEDKDKKKDLRRRNQILLIELDIIKNLVFSAWNEDFQTLCQNYLAGKEEIPEIDEGCMNCFKFLLTTVAQDWKNITFQSEVIKAIVLVTLAYMKKYFHDNSEIYVYVMKIHGQCIDNYFAIKELPTTSDGFTELLVKGYMESMKMGPPPDESERYLDMVDFYLEALPWITDPFDPSLVYENQIWDSIETIIHTVEEECNGKTEIDIESESAKTLDDSDNWIDNLFSTVPIDLDRKHASEMNKKAKINKFRNHICSLLRGLSQKSLQIEPTKVKRILHKFIQCDMTTTDCGYPGDIYEAYERAVKSGAVSVTVQTEMINECLARGYNNNELSVTKLVMAAPDKLRNELAENVFRFFINRLKTKHNDGEKHSFSLNDLLLCRDVRLAMISRKIELFQELLKYFNSLCGQKRMAIDSQVDEIMSLLHILFAGGNFLEYFKQSMSLSTMELITDLEHSDKVTPLTKMDCHTKDISTGFRNFAQWSLTQPGDLCPPYIFPIFTEKELEERDNFIVLSQMFRLLPYFRSTAGNALYCTLYTEGSEFFEKITQYYHPINLEILFTRILVLFTEEIKKKTVKVTSMDCHYILSFYDCLLVAISSGMTLASQTIELLRTTLKHLDLYELSLACARWNYFTGLDRLSALFKIYRNSMLTECMPFQKMVDDCVVRFIVDMIHNDKKKTISPAYPGNSFKLSYEKLDCVLSSDEPTVIEGIIECIRSEICTYLFHQFDQTSNPNYCTTIMDEMAKFCIEVASSGQYSMEDASTANNYLNLMIPENYALHHMFLMETILSVATSIESKEDFEEYPLNKFFGDVIGELFCSEIYAKKWMKSPPMGPIETYLERCSSQEPFALNPNLVSSFSNILKSQIPHPTIKDSLAETLSNRIHLLPKWINNSLFPAITLAEFSGILDFLGDEIVDKIREGITGCVEKVIREGIITELSEFVPIELQSTDRFAQSWLYSRRKKEPLVYAHYKLLKGKTEERKYFEETVVLLCKYGDLQTHFKIVQAASVVLGNWCGLDETEKKIVRGETILANTPLAPNYFELLFRLSVSNTLLKYITEMFTNIGESENSGYFSDIEGVKEVGNRKGVQIIPACKLEAKNKELKSLCTYVTTEQKYIQQHWYNCYTCNFVGQTGCCSICVVNCHRGHDVVYSKYGAFFCDCGAKKCASMKMTSHVPNATNAARGRKVKLTTTLKNDEPEEKKIFPFPENIQGSKEKLILLLTNLREKLTENVKNIENAVKASVDAHITTYDIESKRNHVLASLSNMEKIKIITDQPIMDLLEKETKLLPSISVPRRPPPPENPLLDGSRYKENCGLIKLINGRQLWLMLDGSTVTIHSIIEGANIVEELSTNRVEIEQLPFQARRISCCEEKAVIIGRSEVLLLKFGLDGEIKNKTMLAAGELTTNTNPFTKAVWAPKRPGIVAMAAVQFVKIYDIYMDATSHMEELVLPVANIQDLQFIEDQGTLILLVLSTAGQLYHHVVAQVGQNNSIFLTNTVNIPHNNPGITVSLHYSPASRILFVSHETHSWFSVVPPGIFRTESPTLEWRKIPTDHGFCSWQESSGLISALNFQGGYCVWYFYPTTEQLIIQKVDSHKRVPLGHLLYTSPSNTAINSLLFYYDSPNMVALSSHWASGPDLWIDGLPLEFTTTMEEMTEDDSDNLPVEDLTPMLEYCDLMERIEYISPELLRFYDPGDLNNRLQTVGSCPVTVLQLNKFSISIKSLDTTYIARVVRIEVPDNKGPVKLQIGSRKIAMNSHQSRFFDIYLTRMETLQMDSSPLLLTFLGREKCVVITSIKLYGIRRRDFGFPTPQLSSRAPLSLPEEHLKHLLKLLHVLAENHQVVGNENWLVRITEQLVSIRSTNKEVYTAANNLLRVLFKKKNKVEYYDVKDKILLEDLMHLTGSPQALPAIIVDRLVYQLKLVLATRFHRFLQKLQSIPEGPLTILCQIRQQLRLQSIDENLNLVESFCILSFIFMSVLEGEELDQIFDIFLGIFLDDQVTQHAVPLRIIAITLLNSYAVTCHSDRQKIISLKYVPYLVKHGGLLPYYSRSKILSKVDNIPKEEAMMGAIIPGKELEDTNMYDIEAKHLVELLKKVLLKVRDDGAATTSRNMPYEPVPATQLVLFAYAMLHNLCPEKILPTIIELVEMIDWKTDSLEVTAVIWRQFLLLRLVVLFLTRCSDYIDNKKKKKKEGKNSMRNSRENSEEATEEKVNGIEEMGKKESYEKLLQGISQKLIEADCLSFCLNMLKKVVNLWKGPSPDHNRQPTRAWGRMANENSLPEAGKSDDDFKTSFYGAVMIMLVRLPFQMKKINPSLSYSEDWIDVLCEINSHPYPSQIRYFARKLLIHLSNSNKAEYKSVRDHYLMKNQMKLLKEKFKDQMNHKELTEIVDIIASLATTATERPVMWRAMCEEHLTWMLDMVVRVADTVTTNILELLVAAIRVETNSEESQQLANKLIMVPRNKELLKKLLLRFLIGRDETRRWLAHGLVRSTIQLASRANQMTLIRIMWYELWSEARENGINGAQLADLLATYLPRVFNSNELLNVCEVELTAIEQISKKIVKEGHDRTYEMMIGLGLGLNFMLMVSNPCLNCFSKKKTSETMKLSSIKQDMRYSSNAQMCKLIGFYEVNRVIIKMTDIKRSKTVKKVSVFYCPKVVDSPVELKTKPELWMLAGSTSVISSDNEMVVSLSVPVITSSLIIQFSELVEARQNNELQCPRCSSVVPPQPGVCENCGENAYQCFKCRSINYDDKDPFLCQHCGFCKYARIDVSVVCRPLPRVQPILSDADRALAIEHMSQLLIDVEQSRSQMLIGRAMCESLWLKTRPLPSHTVRAEGIHISEMAVAGMPIIPVTEHAVYCVKEIINYCSQAHDELCCQTQQLLAYRTELLQYDGSSNDLNNLTNGFYNTSSSCFGCLCIEIRHSIAILQGACDDVNCLQKILEKEENYMEIVNIGQKYAPLMPDVESFMCRLSFENESGSKVLCRLVENGILSGSVLCKSIQTYPDSFWEMKLRSLLLTAVDKNDEDTVINTLSVLEKILSDGAPYRKSAYRQLQYGEKNPPEEVPRRKIKIYNRSIDNRSNLAKWMKKKGSWEECEKIEEQITEEEEKMVEAIDNWLWQCLFSQWTLVRSSAAKILLAISKNPGYSGSCIRIIIRGMSLAREKSSQLTEQFFHSVHLILNRRKPLKIRLYLHGLHVHLFSHIYEECRRLYRAETNCLTIDHGNGIILRNYIEVLVNLFCGDSSEGFLLKAAVPNIMKPLLQSTIFLKRLLLHRTRSIDICRSTLELLLRKVGEKEPLLLMQTAVKSLDDDVDQFTLAQIFSIIMEVLAPKQHKDEGFLIVIEKDPAQEDFLQGRMTGNPYRSNDPGFGPLMRDIKNKICRDTEMITLLEDDNGMELLVNNQIISLALPVARVYEKIWHQENPGQPLTIIYRMRGLMGDATEQFIESLGTNEEDSLEDTGLSSLVEHFSKCGGIAKTLSIVESCEVYTGGRILLGSVLSLLKRVSKSEKGRIALVKAGAIRVFTKVFRQCVENGEESMLAIGKDFLKQLDVLVKDTNTHEHLHDLTAEDAIWLMQLTLKKAVKDIAEEVAKLLGNLLLGNEESEEVLVNSCKETLRWTVIDTTTEVSRRKVIIEEAYILCEIIAGILPSSSGHNLKNKIVASGVLEEACGYMLNSHPPLYSATESQEWRAFLTRPSLRLMLTFMSSIAKGHLGSQTALSEQSLPILHRLEQVASDNSIGTLAENVMEALKANDEVAKKIEAVRLETKQKKRQMAMAMRNKQLSKMGMQIGKQGEVKIAARKIANEPHLEEVTDPLTACCICREPILTGEKAGAVYAFATVTLISERMNCLNTVSQMVLVHIDCHMAAVRRSGGGRNADEWSKAMLHNAGARCNVLTPLALNDGSFQLALARYQTDLDVITSTPAVTRFLVFTDLCILIDRFVNFTSFSDKSQGGGRESNCQYLGVLHLLACSLPASEDLRTSLPRWCIYTFLLAEETLEQWYQQRAEVLEVALKNIPQERGGWNYIKTTCIAWAFVDLYFREVIPIVGDRLTWLREHFLETMKKSIKFIQKFDKEIASASDFKSFATILEIENFDFSEALELHQAN